MLAKILYVIQDKAPFFVVIWSMLTLTPVAYLNYFAYIPFWVTGLLVLLAFVLGMAISLYAYKYTDKEKQ